MEHLEALRQMRTKAERLGEENLRLKGLLKLLQRENDELTDKLETLDRQQDQLEKKNLNLQIAHSLKKGGANEHEDSQKTERLKNHIDKLMKEIDRCIHLLKYDNEL